MPLFIQDAQQSNGDDERTSSLSISPEEHISKPLTIAKDSTGSDTPQVEEASSDSPMDPISSDQDANDIADIGEIRENMSSVNILSSGTRETRTEDEKKKDPEEKARAGERLIEEKQQITRIGGIMYIHNDYWHERRKQTINGHLLVGITASQKQALPKAVIAGDIKSQEGAADRVVGLMPSRIYFKNVLLWEELHVLTSNFFNNDQVAPFRSLVRIEPQFRKLHKRKEEEFAEISQKVPNHPAVLQVDCYLPPEFAEDNPKSEYEKINTVEKARLLVDGCRALARLYDTDLGHLMATIRQLQLGGVDRNIPELPFSYLWYLFHPGQEIVSLHPKPQVYRVLQVVGGRMSQKPRGSSAKPTISDLAVDCFSLDFDGKEFGAKPHVFHIKPYDGVLPVTKLPVYPLVYAESGLGDRLIERGEKFEGLATASHRRYKGLSLKEGDLFDVFEEIDSDVIVDFQMAFQNSEVKIPVPTFGDGIIPKPTTEDKEEIYFEGVPYFDDPNLVVNDRYAFIQGTDLLHNQLPGHLNRDHHILLPNRVYGYVLLNRKWLPLDIDLVRKVPKVKPGEYDGFQRLVLPEGHKDIVRALVNTHAHQAVTDDKTTSKKTKRELDVVKGKGRGLIILLHGAPGVGKTSTAECVAANAGRPLFPITCGDLGGTTAREVERNLETYFDLARKWGCVLLLDEADVFLSARERGDILQISLVSVFLRVLEYYSGILILTTNRVGSFDEAIKSRVHCALYYPPLGKEQSLKIWKMNLDMLEERNKSPDQALRVRFDRKEIEEFAKKHWKTTTESARWNGRQIKNAFQTAISLADWDHFQITGGNLHPDGPLLELKHFKTVAKASAHFDDYLAKVRGTDDFRAKQHEARRDDIRNASDWDTAPKKKTGKGSSSKSKPKSKSRVKTPSPEISEESDSEEAPSDELSASSSGSGSESESEEEEAPPPPPSPKPKKKSGKKKSSKE